MSKRFIEFNLYLRHLTFWRSINLILSSTGFFLSRSFRFPIVLGNPYSISVEPNTACNLRCPDCETGILKLGRGGGEMPLDLFQKIIDQTHRSAITILLHFQGEPLLNQNIFEMIKYASSRNLVTEMATNATLINTSVAEKIVRSGLKKIVVSIDSPKSNAFGFYRKGAKFSDVMDGIKSLVRVKKELSSRYPIIVIELLAFHENISQIPEFIELSKQLSVELARVKSAQILNTSTDKSRIPFNTKYSRYFMNSEGKISLKGKEVNYCSAPWFKFSVTHNGWVLPCCFDKSAYYILGSVKLWDTKQIWYSNHYNKFRRNLLVNRKRMPICNNCPNNRVRFDFPV